jgi:hypothetical protein
MAFVSPMGPQADCPVWEEVGGKQPISQIAENVSEESGHTIGQT